MALVGDDIEFKVLENQHKICCAMDDEEKSGSKMILSDDKKSIAEVTQLKVSDICDLLYKYE